MPGLLGGKTADASSRAPSPRSVGSTGGVDTAGRGYRLALEANTALPPATSGHDRYFRCIVCVAMTAAARSGPAAIAARCGHRGIGRARPDGRRREPALDAVRASFKSETDKAQPEQENPLRGRTAGGLIVDPIPVRRGEPLGPIRPARQRAGSGRTLSAPPRRAAPDRGLRPRSRGRPGGQRGHRQSCRERS
jgi:hypothetical protein